MAFLSQMLFEYRPKHVGTVEALWLLDIAELDLQHPVLFVGKASEPKATLKPAILELRSTLQG